MAKTKKLNMADKSSKTAEWYTPERVLGPVRAYFGGKIPLDPATRADNPTGAVEFFTLRDNGLEQDWGAHDGVFINCPYGAKTDFHAFLEKIREEAALGTTIIALLPMGSRFETGYWQRDVLNIELDAICFIRKRLRFIDESGAVGKSNTYGSALYGFNADMVRFTLAFSSLGKIFGMQLWGIDEES